jgi:NADH:ubiquinone oxidoreductase subunit 6 (subunit J)
MSLDPSSQGRRCSRTGEGKGAALLIDVVQIVLIVVTIALALLTLETRDLFHAVICLCGMCITIGILFGILNAPYVMVFQLLIYAGAAIVLFIAVIMLTTREATE